MQERALSEAESRIVAQLSDASAIIFDMDGTLVLGDKTNGGLKALPGAVELLRLLRRRDIPFRVFTNGTAKPPAAYAASLRSAGLDLEDSEMMTPSTAAAAWFVKKGIKRIRVLGLEGVQEPLRRAGLDVVGPAESATGIEAVFTGWYREFVFADLERACQDIWNGAMLTTASNVPFFAAEGGRAIGASFAINAMVRSLTGARPKVLGKPAPEALRCALTLMGLPGTAAKRTVVVGDDPALEVRMARASGAIAVAVTTGLVDRETFVTAAPNFRPDAVLANLDPIIAALAAPDR
jgi:HAD superfamily hydrolase (TIGR01450 family)